MEESLELLNLRNKFEAYLEQAVLSAIPAGLPELSRMVSYHFGWSLPRVTIGKRLRPLLLLLNFAVQGGVVDDALLAAAAIEILHNYTLVHDDIEDQGNERHGQLALWKVFGRAQAINTGDFLSSLAQKFMGSLQAQHNFLPQRIFQQAALDVTRGQHLDMLYEKMPFIEEAHYLDMIRLKTARLFAAACSVGSALAGGLDDQVKLADQLGESLGMGFQIEDDYLGIWGNSQKLGKSTSSDIISRKKTYPVLFGLSNKKTFFDLWSSTELIDETSASRLAELLKQEGAEEYTLAKIQQYKTMSLAIFSKFQNPGSQYYLDLESVILKSFKLLSEV